MPHITRLIGIAAAGALVCSGAAHAAIYTNKSNFLAATGPLATITFDDLLGTPAFPRNNGTGYYGTDIRIGLVDFGQGLDDYIFGPDYRAGAVSLNGTPALTFGGGYGSVSLLPRFTGALGFDIGLDSGASGSVEIRSFLINGTITTTVLNLSGKSGFFGYAGAVPAAAFDITYISQPQKDFGIPLGIVLDNVQFSLPSVPEPDSLILLASGGVTFAAIGLGRRRQRGARINA